MYTSINISTMNELTEYLKKVCCKVVSNTIDDLGSKTDYDSISDNLCSDSSYNTYDSKFETNDTRNISDENRNYNNVVTSNDDDLSTQYINQGYNEYHYEDELIVSIYYSPIIIDWTPDKNEVVCSLDELDEYVAIEYNKTGESQSINTQSTEEDGIYENSYQSDDFDEGMFEDDFKDDSDDYSDTEDESQESIGTDGEDIDEYNDTEDESQEFTSTDEEDTVEYSESNNMNIQRVSNDEVTKDDTDNYYKEFDVNSEINNIMSNEINNPVSMSPLQIRGNEENVKISADQDIPKSVVEYVKMHKFCSIEKVLEYYDRKEVDMALNTGKICKVKNKLYL